LVDPEVFDRRLARLETLLRDLRRLAGLDLATFRSDATTRAAAERWLHLSAECALDLANHLIADQGWRTPTTYREVFEILAEQSVLDAKLAEQMQAWAGLRNVLVHVYLEIDHDRLHAMITGELDQLEAFAAAISRAAARAEDRGDSDTA
jgi:uncharacterized protein YutE (UPF0331/DUF86 family)